MATSTVRVLFLGESGSALRATRSLEGGFGGLSRTASVLGKTLAVGIVGGLVASAKAAVDFDRSMRSVNTLTKLSEKGFQSLSKSVLALAKETGKAPNDLAKGLYDVVSSGFKANDAIKILRVSAKAAAAGLTDTATATKAINAALNAYHLSADDARKVSDILFKTVEKGVLTFEELAQNMGDLVPAAAPLGVTLEEVGAAIATITLQGVPAAEAATRVKNTMLQLASPSKALTGLLKENGFASGEAAIKARGFVGVLELLQKATGGNVTETAKLTPEIRALLGVVGLTGKNLDTYLANLEAMKRAQAGAGATAAAFAEQGKSISFQWNRAKAALTAAAIPVGQLLFPALVKGAEGVSLFAEGVQRHMPQIRSEFQSVSGVIADVGRVAGDVARTDLGQAGLVGALGALGAVKVVEKLALVRAGIMGLSGPVGLVAAAVGILAGAWFYSQQRADDFAESLERLKQALSGQEDSERNLTQAKLRARAADDNLQVSRLALERATRSASEAEQQYGKRSLEAREARAAVKLAENGLAQARVSAKDVAKDLQRAEQGVAESTRESRNAMVSARAETLRVIKAAKQFGDEQRAGTDANRLLTGALTEFGHKLFEAERGAGNAAGTAREYANAVRSLFNELGRLPSVKEIKIYVTEIRRRVGPGLGGDTGRGGVGRAGGGFIPMIAGATASADSVPAMLTPGEIVLNRSQQNVLGGPRYLADLFGFRGERGPGFAAGGIVPPGQGRLRRGRYPHRPVRTRAYSRVTKAARSALAASERVADRITDLDRSYGQLQREFSISPEEPIVTDAEGNEILDAAAVSKHMSEIGSLIQHRNRMLALLETEKEKLQAAIDALRKAIAALLVEMNKEREAAAADAEQARRLARDLADSEKDEDRVRRQPAKTEAARKARDKEVARFDAVQDRLRSGIDRAKESERRHFDKRRSLGTLRSDLQGNVVTASDMLHSVPFDRRDVELDVAELMQEAREWSAVRARPGFGGGGGGGGGGGFGGDGGGVSGDLLADLGIVPSGAELADELIRQLGLSRLAGRVEAVQLGVIGSFQKGTIYVPETGLAFVHAGERISPAGVAAPTVVEGPPVIVQIAAKDGALAELIDVRVIRNVPEIAARLGRNAELRSRAGGY